MPPRAALGLLVVLAGCVNSPGAGGETPDLDAQAGLRAAAARPQVDFNEDYGCILDTQQRLRCFGELPELSEDHPPLPLGEPALDLSLDDRGGVVGFDGLVQAWGMHFVGSPPSQPGGTVQLANGGRNLGLVGLDGRVDIYGEKVLLEELLVPDVPLVQIEFSKGWAGLGWEGELVAWGYDTDGGWVLDGSFVAMGAGKRGPCGVTEAGDVWCPPDAEYAWDGPRATEAVQIDPGWKAACMVDVAGRLDCWGQEGNPVIDEAPADDGYISVTVREHSACALREDDGVVCWAEAAERFGAAPL